MNTAMTGIVDLDYGNYRHSMAATVSSIFSKHDEETGQWLEISTPCHKVEMGSTNSRTGIIALLRIIPHPHVFYEMSLSRGVGSIFSYYWSSHLGWRQI